MNGAVSGANGRTVRIGRSGSGRCVVVFMPDVRGMRSASFEPDRASASA
jgi:hypothetical protein